MNYDPIDFGALADGISDDTLAIRKAIEQASINKGIVVFSKDRVYRSGLIELLDNTTLCLEEGSKLMMSDNLNMFSKNEEANVKPLDKPTYEDCSYDGLPNLFFIYAKGKNHIRIVGDGVIDGNEKIFYGKENEHHIDGSFYPRVPMIFFEDCNDVLLNKITLQHSAFWTVHLVGCNGVLIDNITINNNRILANSDGIDPDHCKNVIIKNSKISSADDCIVLKTTEAFKKYGPCECIEVFNCVLSSTSAAIKIGTETASDFNKVYFHDCNILDSNRGISIQLRDEGNIEHCIFENIYIETKRFEDLYWWGKGEGIAVTAVRRNEDTKVGRISRVEFQNIKMKSENGIFICGENHNIDHIMIDSVNLELVEKTNYKKDFHDLRPCAGEYIVNSGFNYLYCKDTDYIKFIDFNTKNSTNNKIDEECIFVNCEVVTR